MAAYWINPRGQIIEVELNHIDTVIKYPAKFGLTKKEIEKIHKKHKEKVGQEGNAREAIIVDLIKSGWIRIRKYKNHWSITVFRLTSRVIYSFANKILKKGLFGFKEKDKYASVKIVPVGGGKMVQDYDLSDISKDMLIEEGSRQNRGDRHVLTEVKNAEDLEDWVNPEINEVLDMD